MGTDALVGYPEWRVGELDEFGGRGSKRGVGTQREMEECEKARQSQHEACHMLRTRQAIDERGEEWCLRDEDMLEGQLH
jgi:hypothetical protein